MVTKTGGMANTAAKDVDSYLADVPEPQRSALEKLRRTILAAAPNATEGIGYQMPMYKLNGPLVAYAAFKNHCSFFVMSTAVAEAHRDDLARYDTAKGTVRFQPEKPLPAGLVRKLVRARMAENEAAVQRRKERKRKK